MENYQFVLNDSLYIQLVAAFAVLCLLKPSSLRYYLCYGFYIGTTLFFSVLYIPIFLLRPRNPANLSLLKPIAFLISKIIGIRWELRGAEHLEVDRAAVIIGNHQSLFDALGIAEISRSIKKGSPISRKEIFYYWPFGLSAWLGGIVFIDRRGGKDAFTTLRKTSSTLIKYKAKLVIFPEGTRNRSTENFLPFKKGAFWVAISSQIPILPIVYSPYYFIDSHKKNFSGGHMIIKAMEAIPTNGLTMDDLDSLVEKTRNLMMEQYKLLKLEIIQEFEKEM